jgi:hypothetical protein
MDRVVIEAAGDDVASVAAQIPRAESLAKGTRVVVFAGKARGWFGKMLARGDAPMSAIGSALLARGYVDVRAGEEEGRACAWGEA